MTSRELARAARRLADQQTDRFAGLPLTRMFYANIETVGAGTSVTLIWRGGSDLPATAAMHYTPAVGDRVLCLVDEFGQAVVVAQTG